MEVSLFENIVTFINNYKGLSKDCLEELKTLHPTLSSHTLASILCTRYQKKMMVNHGKVKKNKANVLKRYEQGLAAKEEPGLIIRMAKEYDVAPALVAKVVLEGVLQKKSNKSGEKDQNPVATKNKVKEMMKDSTKIQDPDLAYEVFLSVVFDNMYGPISDMTKMCLGNSHEVKLQRFVEKAGLAFKNEETLRAKGYDKTPDIKLETPCAVDGFIINWIESKAVFADDATHAQYAKDQYHSYWNRFGTGLVIYWFGYLKPVIDPSEKRYIVRDNFPEKLTLMDPDLIPLPKLKLY